MMKRVMLLCLAIGCLFFSVTVASENIGLLKKGGRVEFLGVPYSERGIDNAFDGNNMNPQFAYDVVRQTKNHNVGVDRIWDSKVKINKIELKTTGAGRAYEYKFLYWDLDENDWKEIVHVVENADSNPVHNFKTPIVTNKMRYICLKAGEDGTANFHNIYQIYYFGEVL